MRSLLILMFVAGTLPMAFMRPVIGLLLWMTFSYMNPHRYAWGFAVNFPWVFIIAIVTIVGIIAQPTQRRAPPGKPIVILLTFFLFWCTLTTLQAVVHDAALSRYEEFVKVMVMVYATTMLVDDRQKLNWVIWTIVISFGFWGLKGGVFTVLTGGSHHVMGPMHSFFTDNNIFALIMCMTLPLMRYLQLYTQNWWVRIGLWALMGFTAISVIGTYSRGGLLALGVTVALLVWKSRRRGLLMILVPLLAIGMASFMPPQYFARMHTIDNNYHTDASAVGRIQSWEFATHVGLAHPLFGGGMEVWSSHQMWREYGPKGAVPGRAIHNAFFEVLAEQGFVGLAIYVMLIVFGYFTLSRLRRRARAGPVHNLWLADLASMMQVSLVAFAAAGSLLPVTYVDFLYQLLGLIAVMQVMVDQPIENKIASQEKVSASSARSRYTRVGKRPLLPPKSSRHTPKDGKPPGLSKLPDW